MFSGFANIGALLKQAKAMSGQMEGLSRELKSRKATGSAGGGMVEIDVNGANEALACRIDERLLSGGDRELLEDLILGAMNDALGKAKQLHLEALKSMTGGLNLPGMEDMLSQLGGGPPPESTGS